MKFKLFNKPDLQVHDATDFIRRLGFCMLFFWAAAVQGQSYAYFEKYDVSSFSRSIIPSGANPNNWQPHEQTAARPWTATEHTEKMINPDGTFSIVTDHLTNERYPIAADKPKRTVVNQNGIRIIDWQDSVVMDLPYNGAVLSTYPGAQGSVLLANIGKYPDFQPLTQTQIAILQAEGWAVSVFPSGETVMLRGNMRKTISPNIRKTTLEKMVENQVRQRWESRYQLDATNQIAPWQERYTEYKTMSNGDCVEQERVRYYRNILIDRTNLGVQPRSGNADETALGVQLAPNPATESVNLTWKTGSGAVDIQIFDNLGRLAWSVAGQTGSSLTIDVSELVRGSYLVSIISSTSRETLRFLKQ